MFPTRGVANRGSVGGLLRRTALIVAVAGVAMAAGPTVTAASDGSAAQQLVQQVTTTIIDELTERRDALQNDPQAVYELVHRLVLPHFDFERMSRRVIGKKRWNAATPAQRTQFVSAFRTLMVRTYAVMLNEYRGQALSWLDPMPRKKENEFVIPVTIELAGGAPARVDYAMHGSGSDWKVFDVALDGVSLVRNYRSSFRSELARHGIDGLIASIEAKNAAMN